MSETPPTSSRSSPDASAFPPSFLDNLGFIINKVAETFDRRVEPVTLAAGLAKRPYGFLLLLRAEGSQAQIALGERVGLDRTSTTRTVDLLETRGLVRRDPDPNDRRKHSVVLTDAGNELLERTVVRVRQAELEFGSVLSGEEQAQLLSLLKRLLRLEGGA